LVQWAYDQGYVNATETSVTDALGSTQELLDLNDVGSEIAFGNGVFSLRDAGHGINPNHPVKAVTWFGAAAYCDWLSLREGLSQAYNHTNWTCNGGDPYRAQGYRLPTDAEWEYAAQFDDERIYPWGNEAPNAGLANIRRDYQTGWTEPVGSYPAEKIIGGRELHDMAGNVYEWCNDWHRCAAAPSPIDPPGPTSGTYRILHGGSWVSDSVSLRCSYRFLYASPPNPPVLYRHGFRVVRTVDP
jgi:formylglycine-generating enzyme required for sulfatase activity